MLKIIQLTKIKALVSFDRMLKRYRKLIDVCDNRTVSIYIGGEFTLEDTGDFYYISEDNSEQFLQCFTVGLGEIIWIETTWDEHFANVIETKRHPIKFTRKTNYYFGIVV